MRGPAQGDGKEYRGGNETCGQPEVDGLFRTAGGDQIRHAGKGQGVRQVDQGDGEKSGAENDGVTVVLDPAQIPGEGKDHG